MLFVLGQFGCCVLTVGGIGLLAHILGEALPRGAFDWTRFPYAPYAWEQDGKFYSKLRIERWKNRLPDKSKFVKSTVEKSIRASGRTAAHMERLVQETCVAECVHWALLLVSPVLLLTMEGPWNILMTILYGLSNLPFIMIQRYNRPRLVKMLHRMGRPAQTFHKEGEIRHEAADSVLQ
ncbi:MAG: hypothetical protein RRZ24_08615 [Clostridia bacterium]